MPKRLPTKADKLRFSIITQLGCIVCGGPAEIHHLTGAGMGQKAPHDQTIGLCHMHHRTGGPGFALHAGEKTWEEIYGTQEELLEKQNRLIERHKRVTEI